MIEPSRDLLHCASRSDKPEGPCPSYRRCRPVQIWYPIAKCWSPSLHAAALVLRHHDPHDESVGDRLCLDWQVEVKREYGLRRHGAQRQRGENYEEDKRVEERLTHAEPVMRREVRITPKVFRRNGLRPLPPLIVELR